MSELRFRWQGRLPRAAVTAGTVLAAALAGAGCGGGASTPAVATISTTTRTSGTAAGDGPPAAGLLAFASCMRSHGVANFPDPTEKGGIPKQAVLSALEQVGNSRADGAQNACRNLLPAGGSLSGRPTQTVTVQQQRYYLKAAACMRSHGLTNFPDPSFSGGQVEFPMLERLVDIHSALFTQARRTCSKLIPAGLPDSRPGS